MTHKIRILYTLLVSSSFHRDWKRTRGTSSSILGIHSLRRVCGSFPREWRLLFRSVSSQTCLKRDKGDQIMVIQYKKISEYAEVFVRVKVVFIVFLWVQMGKEDQKKRNIYEDTVYVEYKIFKHTKREQLEQSEQSEQSLRSRYLDSFAYLFL